MTPLDICFTPLDIPDRPDVDMNQFLSWIKDVYPQPVKEQSKKRHAESDFQDSYPWDLTFARYRGEWQDNFNVLFPELAKYVCDGFSLNETEIDALVFLPIRPNMTGTMFWHNDIDDTGLRFYLECEDYENNPLLLRKFSKPHSVLTMFTHPINDPEPRLQDEVFECKLPGPHSAFYVNNIRAVHAPYISKQQKRIAGFIVIKAPYVPVVKKRLADLIVKSAEKFKDCAILY